MILKFVQFLYKKKELKIWDGYHLDFTFEKKENKKKFIGVKGNNVISKFYTKNIRKNFQSPIKSIFYNKYFWEIKLDTKEIVKAKSVIDSAQSIQGITSSISKGISKNFKNSIKGLINPYGNGGSSMKIFKRIKEMDLNLLRSKKFHVL